MQLVKKITGNWKEMAESYCRINFQGQNGGYLTIDPDGALRVSTTDKPGNDKLIFEKQRVGIENKEEKVMFRSYYDKEKYISGYEHEHIVTGVATYIEGKLQPNHSHWVLKNYADLTDDSDRYTRSRRVALYHPQTQLYFVIKHDPHRNGQDFCLSNSDDVQEYGAFILESSDGP